jgi:alpha-galactosidase/6-phospho-beta-glucosidase family protein
LRNKSEKGSVLKTNSST